MSTFNRIARNPWIQSLKIPAYYHAWDKTFRDKITEVSKPILVKEFLDIFTPQNVIIVGVNIVLIHFGTGLFLMGFLVGMGTQLISPNTVETLKTGCLAMNLYTFKHPNIMLRTAWTVFNVCTAFLIINYTMLFLTAGFSFRVGADLAQLTQNYSRLSFKAVDERH